jgi:hypothetical protein
MLEAVKASMPIGEAHQPVENTLRSVVIPDSRKTGVRI